MDDTEIREVMDRNHGAIKIKTVDATKPDYYRGRSGRDVIDVINEFGLGFMAGNVVKYVVRAGRKDANRRPDLGKAAEYLRRMIEEEERLTP